MTDQGLLILTVCLFLASCGSDRRNGQQSDIEYSTETDEYLLEWTDSVIVPVKNHTNVQAYVQLAGINGQEYLINFQRDPFQNNFHLYSLVKRNFYKTISFEREGPNGVGELSPFANFIGMDSILLYTANSNRFHLADSSGTVLRRIDVSGVVRGTAYPQPSFHSEIVSNELQFFVLGEENPNDPSFYKKVKAEYILDLNSNEVTNNYPTYPSYPAGIENTFDAWKVSRCLGLDGEYVYSFPFDNSIYVPSRNDYRQYVIPNQLFHIAKVEQLDPTSYEAQMEVVGRFGLYTYLHRDPFRQLYYRIYLLPGPSKDFDNKLIMLAERPFRLEIISQDFQLVGKKDFSARTYNPYCILISKDGLLFSKINPHAPQTESHFMFDRFTVTKR